METPEMENREINLQEGSESTDLSNAERYEIYNGIPRAFSDWVAWYIEDVVDGSKLVTDLFIQRNMQPDIQAEVKDFDLRLNQELLAFWKVASFSFDFQVLNRMKDDRKNLFKTDDYDWGKRFLDTKVEWCKTSIENLEARLNTATPDLVALRLGLKWRRSDEQLEALMAQLHELNLVDKNWKAYFQDQRLRWLGTMTDLAVVLKVLSGNKLIDYRIQLIGQKLFYHSSGEAISQNLADLAGRESKPTRLLYASMSRVLKVILPEEQAARVQC